VLALDALDVLHYLVTACLALDVLRDITFHVRVWIDAVVTQLGGRHGRCGEYVFVVCCRLALLLLGHDVQTEDGYS
jgi:hypothetical protein